MPWTTLCDLDELKEGIGKYVEIDGHQLAVFLQKDQVYVIDNLCPHAGASLAGGFVDEDACVVCPWHGWTFRLGNGEMRGSPGVKISTYTTRILPRDGQSTLVQADLPMP